MAKTETTSESSGFGAIAPGMLGAIAAAAIFVVLTALTGTTYHLFPLLIGFLPAGLPRVLAERPIRTREGVIAASVGVVAVLAGWLTLELLEEMPAATLIPNQPGGVGGEFALFGVVGALLGGWWGTRRPWRLHRSGASAASTSEAARPGGGRR